MASVTVDSPGLRARFIRSLALGAAASGALALSSGGAAASNGLCIKNGAFSLCIDTPDSSGGGTGVTPQKPETTLVQSIVVTTANGSPETLSQAFYPNEGSPSVARICLTNKRGGMRTLTHNFMPKINPFHLDPGGRNCANFPANSRVNFKPYAAGKPASPAKNLTYNTAVLAGGRLELVWN